MNAVIRYGQKVPCLWSKMLRVDCDAPEQAVFVSHLKKKNKYLYLYEQLVTIKKYSNPQVTYILL